jgi:hypothetical protein
MKTLLITTFVFGGDYQGYIPIFIYFVHKNYPEYDVKIYTDRKLEKRYEDMLQEIPGYLQGKYTISKIHEKMGNASEQQKKAYRWLKYEEDYLNYKYVYTGDIDIIICKEKIPLHEQHIKHMKSQDTCFSNIVRDYGESILIKKYEDILKKFRIYTPVNDFYKKFIYHKRLSGLHFVETKTFYGKTKKCRDNYLSSYEPHTWKEYLYNMDMRRYSNEALLYKIVKKSNLHIPKQVTSDQSVLFCNDSSSNEFRPYHGIHLGIWRSKMNVRQYTDFVNKPMNIDFYMQFMDAYRNDDVLKRMIGLNNSDVKRNINAMIHYYENKVGVIYGN